ncbi:MAG: hypothetical protein NC489_23450 [Ruminococcus flavefaciens]|nr:hypothetical protein [Ruminococcus flavefaciens]
MKKNVCAAIICALTLAGLTACGSAGVPAVATNPPASQSEAQNLELNHPTVTPDAPETNAALVASEGVGADPNVSLQLPESEVPTLGLSSPAQGTEPPQTAPTAKPAETEAPSAAQESKILIAYFTWAENTVVADPSAVDVDATTSASILAPGHVAQMAAWIQGATGGDLFSIVTAEPYSSDYDECLNRAADEKAASARPALTGSVANMADYDVVFLGYPDWWATCPMAVFTFLDSYDFTGKTVIPFCAHGTSGLAASVRDIRAALPGVTVLDAVGVQRPGMDTPLDTARSTVASWLAGLDY